MIRYFVILCFLAVHFQIFGQGKPDSSKADTSVKKVLPFAIANEKKLSDEDLLNKKEGVYVTGLPDFSSDPINGFGYGGEALIFFNGKKNDPFFQYTAYRAELGVTLFNTSREQREVALHLDVPYIFNTKWRLRIETAYESNPNLLYFGTTEKSLGILLNPGDSTKYSKYKDYENSLSGDFEFYNTYNKKEFHLNASMERSFFDGKVRLLGGIEAAYVDFSTFVGRSKLMEDVTSKSALGLGKYWVTFAQVGFIYDTRDLEPDPSQGVFAELTNELSLKAIGSSYNFNKTFFHFNYYQKVLPGIFKKFVFAGRVSMGYTAGDAPFFEYQDQWSSEGSIEGLGGPNTLRGYKQSRFLGRLMNFNNFELRYRFAETDILKQHLAFSAVPFYDIGGVWDDYNSFSKFKNFRDSEGGGLRIAWNVNTIIRLDYAISKEDRQFFFNLSHAF